MGYYEQIGVANRAHAERLARMHPAARAARRVVGTVALVGAAALLWAVSTSPLWLPLVNLYRSASQ